MTETTAAFGLNVEAGGPLLVMQPWLWRTLDPTGRRALCRVRGQCDQDGGDQVTDHRGWL